MEELVVSHSCTCRKLHSPIANCARLKLTAYFVSDAQIYPSKNCFYKMHALRLATYISNLREIRIKTFMMCMPYARLTLLAIGPVVFKMWIRTRHYTYYLVHKYCFCHFQFQIYHPSFVKFGSNLESFDISMIKL